MFRFLILVFFFICTCGCAKKSSSQCETITVMATPIPHALILKHIRPQLSMEGICLKIIEIDDYKIPNRLLFEGQIDGNFFQHVSFFENECLECGYDNLSILARIHLEPMGIYSKKQTVLSDLLNNYESIKISVPTDATNEKRALDLLSSLGIISFKPGREKNTYATKLDILGIGRKVDIVEIPAPMLVRSLSEVDFAVIPANFALDAGFQPDKDALFLEKPASSQYVNIVAVRTESLDGTAFQKLKKHLLNSSTREFVEAEFQGSLRFADFQLP